LPELDSRLDAPVHHCLVQEICPGCLVARLRQQADQLETLMEQPHQSAGQRYMPGRNPTITVRVDVVDDRRHRTG
jgi:hypothetical protein